jgi:hypothetical protein
MFIPLSRSTHLKHLLDPKISLGRLEWCGVLVCNDVEDGLAVRNKLSPHLPLNSAHFSLPPGSDGFFLGIFANPEYGGDKFLRNVSLSPNYIVI